VSATLRTRDLLTMLTVSKSKLYPDLALGLVPGRDYQRITHRVAGGERPSEVAVVYGVTPRGLGMEPPSSTLTS
jgi:hypothetical protein